MKKQMLFETYLHTVQLSQNSFMKEYQSEILPLLENNDLNKMHYKLKDLARVSETTTIRSSEVTLNKLCKKAELVLESNKFELVKRVHAIGIKYPEAAALSSAMITTAIVENQNPEYVLTPGIKVLHRAFLSEADIPAGFQFENDQGGKFSWDGEDWYDIRSGREVPEGYTDTINAQALKAMETQEATLQEPEYEAEEEQEDVPYADYIGEDVPAGYQLEDGSGDFWTYDDDVWTNDATGAVLDGDAHDSATQSALHTIAYEEFLEDNPEYGEEADEDTDEVQELEPLSEPSGEYSPSPEKTENPDSLDTEAQEEFEVAAEEDPEILDDIDPTNAEEIEFDEEDPFELTSPSETSGPEAQEDDIEFDEVDPAQQEMDFSEPKVDFTPQGTVEPTNYSAKEPEIAPKKADYSQADEVKAMQDPKWDPAEALNKYAAGEEAAKTASEEEAAWAEEDDIRKQEDAAWEEKTQDEEDAAWQQREEDEATEAQAKLDQEEADALAQSDKDATEQSKMTNRVKDWKANERKSLDDLIAGDEPEQSKPESSESQKFHPDLIKAMENLLARTK